METITKYFVRAGWIGVDLDGTLAEYEYDHPFNPFYIGRPIPAMIDRVKRWLDLGYEVRIVTARVSGRTTDNAPEIDATEDVIHRWCERHLGQQLRVTCCKDYDMLELWDDRAVQVEPNTGKIIGKSTRGL